MGGTLHITNGDSAAAVMRQAGFAGEILPWRDVLHEGPVSAELPLTTLSHLRAHFLADKGWAELETVQAQMAVRDRLLAAAAGFERIVLWFEHDLLDQLQLLQILSWFADHERGQAGLDMLCIDSFPGIVDFGGLGQLTPAQMGSLRGSEQPVTAGQLALAKAGFEAFGAGDPRRLVEVLRRDFAPLPHLRPALARMLEEYPWQGDGLARSRRQLLWSVKTSGGDLAAMFRVCTHMEAARYLGDIVFLDYAEGLAEAREPALRFIKSSPAEDSSPWQQLALLTRFGEQLLNGDADFITANGINRWIGGVHLTRDRWRYDPATKTVLPTGID
ncbi:MAG TPA: DUF1835 domain-containing protein [Candidatus Acidoferrum sp.]|nr:DUF1835 domain-containing protein [Candidatus Acidoferrum sp.]